MEKESKKTSEEEIVENESTNKETANEETKAEEVNEKENASEQSEKKDAEEEALEQKFIRLSADFQNYKRRTEKEKSDIYKSANAALITSLIPIIDDFERAFSHADESDKEAFLSGMEMIFKNLMDVLQKEGLEKIEAFGEKFDPNFHHAVMTEESDEFESEHVTAELQKGYKLKEKVLRPSMVKVSS